MRLDRLLRHNRLLFAGAGYISGEDSGIVTVKGVPSARRVVLFDRATLTVVRAVWSADDGRYRLDHLDPQRDYIAMALDDKGQYEPVAYDFVRPYLDPPP